MSTLRQILQEVADLGFQAGCTVPRGHLCLDSDGWRYVRPGSAVEDGFVKDLACCDGTFESEEELRAFSQYSYLQNVQKGPLKYFHRDFARREAEAASCFNVTGSRLRD
jgi:hypothetical protein